MDEEIKNKLDDLISQAKDIVKTGRDSADSLKQANELLRHQPDGETAKNIESALYALKEINNNRQKKNSNTKKSTSKKRKPK